MGDDPGDRVLLALGQRTVLARHLLARGHRRRCRGVDRIDVAAVILEIARNEHHSIRCWGHCCRAYIITDADIVLDDSQGASRATSALRKHENYAPSNARGSHEVSSGSLLLLLQLRRPLPLLRLRLH